MVQPHATGDEPRHLIHVVTLHADQMFRMRERESFHAIKWYNKVGEIVFHIYPQRD